jgi:hypothetical protein
MKRFGPDREVGARAGRTVDGESQRFGAKRLSDMPETKDLAAKKVQISMSTRVRSIVVSGNKNSKSEK